MLHKRVTTVAGVLLALVVVAVIIGRITSTEAAAAKPAPKAKPAPVAAAAKPKPVLVDDAPAQAPILLHPDAGIAAGWGVAGAATVWNTATGCTLFAVVPFADGAVRVEEVAKLSMPDGTKAWGVAYDDRIELDPQYGADSRVVLHELGHLLDLPHSDDPHAVMFGGVGPDAAAPTAAEVAAVRQLHADRCPR